MNVTVSSGKFDVISSGLVIADNWESDIEFHININKLIKLHVKLRFIEEEGAERDFRIESEEAALVFKCVNFGDTVGTSYPLEIASFSGKKIYFNFRNYEEKKVMRKIEYTFYTDK